jgi:hypothetical protein
MGFSLQCGGAMVLCERHSLIVFLQKLATHEREQNKYEEKYFSLIYSAAKFKPIEDTEVSQTIFHFGAGLGRNQFFKRVILNVTKCDAIKKEG